MNTAACIVNSQGLTMKDRRNWADLACLSFEWVGRDMCQSFFKDGSSVLMQMDEDLVPMEIIVVD